MLYEFRRYRAAPGKLQVLLRRYEEYTIDCLARHGVKVRAVWTPLFGAPTNELYVLLEHPTLADREAKWPQFAQDKERIARFAETEADGPLYESVTVTIFKPTPRSPEL